MRVLDVLSVFITGGLVGVLLQRHRNAVDRLEPSIAATWALVLMLGGQGVQSAARLLEAGPDLTFAAWVVRTLAFIAGLIVFLRSGAPRGTSRPSGASA